MREVDYGLTAAARCLMIGVDIMKKIYKGMLIALSSCLLFVSGCSTGNADKPITPKQVLLEAIDYSNQLEAFNEDYEEKVLSGDVLHHSNNNNFMCYQSQNFYSISNQSDLVMIGLRSMSIMKGDQGETTLIEGTPSSTSFRDLSITEAEYSQEAYNFARQEYFSNMFESYVADDVEECVAFEMEKNEEGFLITITLKDMEKFNEISKEKQFQKYGETPFYSYTDFCMTVQISNGLIKEITWNDEGDWDGIVQKRDNIAVYTAIPSDKINTELIDDLSYQVQSNLLGEGDYVMLDDLIR